jgi:hypothetical protein
VVPANLPFVVRKPTGFISNCPTVAIG